jgi:hypothetical protein
VGQEFDIQTLTVFDHAHFIVGFSSLLICDDPACGSIYGTLCLSGSPFDSPIRPSSTIDYEQDHSNTFFSKSFVEATQCVADDEG